METERLMGSGALPVKMLLVRMIENNKIDAYLGHIRLIKCQRCLGGVEKGLGQGPAGSINRKKHIFNNPIFGIKPGSPPDPNNDINKT